MWKSLSRTMHFSLLPWAVCTALVLLMVFVQTITGKLGDAAPVVWCWAGVLLLPGLAMLLGGALLSRYAGQHTPPAAHYLLLALLWLYLVLVLLTLLNMLQNDHGLIAYFQGSYWWLAPLNVLLLAGFGLFFWRKVPIFQPDQKVILEMAGKQLKKAVQQGDAFRQSLLEAVSAGELPRAFSTLQQSKAPDDKIQADIAVLQGEYTQLIRNRELNLIAPADAQRQLNRITVALIHLLP